MEIVVRGGKFFTIGDTGAEFFSYKKGDVIFNAEQSKQILEKGKITHGMRRGRALASGTAFIEGNAFRFSTTQGNDGSSSSSGSKHSSKHSSDKSSSKKKRSKSKSSDKDDDDSTKIDWIEVAIDRAERAIKKLKTIADSVYKTFKDRNQSIQKDIKKTTEEISLQEKAYERYEKEFRKAASEGKLATATINKIKDGTIDITKYNKDQQKAITEAKKWYDKALDAKDAIDKLKESVSALAKQRFDNVVKAWSNSFQDAEHAADRLEEKIKNTTSTASDYISLTGNKYTSSTTNNINDYKDLIKNYRNQRDRRLFEVQDLKHKLDEAVKSGNIAVGSEAYYQMLKQIQSVEDEIDELNGKIIESSNSLAEQYKIAFDRVADLADNKKQELDHKANEYNNYLELAEAKGFQTSATYYKRLKSIEEKNLQNAKKLATDLQKQLNNALKSGKIKIGSQAWYDMSQRIYEAREAIQESTIAIANFDNEIRKVSWDKFDYLQDRIGDVTDEVSFLIDLMDNDELFKENGKITSRGLATLGLHATNYNVYMGQANQYAKEIKKINKQIAEDPSNNDLIERKAELVKAHRQVIKAAESEKQAEKSLVSEGIKMELSYIKELISKYNDATSAQKSLYDYQKKVRDQTSDIASLQKQLSAYSNDTSEEARAKVQQLQVSLKDKQEELQETEYERMISDSKKLLDDFYDEYEKALNSRLDNLDQLISDSIDTANQNATKISKTIESEAKSVGYTLSDDIKNIWNKDNVDPVLSIYSKEFSTALTTVNSTLSNIGTYVKNLWDVANAQANKDDNKVKSEASNKKSSEKKATTPAPKKSSGGTSGKASTPAKAKTPGSSYTGLWKDGNSTYYYVKGKKQTGWKNMKEGRRYFSAKDGKMLVGEQVIGGKRFYFDKTKGILKTGTFIADGNYYNTDKNGVIIFKSKRDAGTSNPNGIANTTSLTKAKGYASGAKRISRNQLAWTNEGSGLETIVRASDKAVLTKVSRDSRIYNAMASENLWQAANNPEKFISQHTGSILTSGSLHSGGNVNQTFDNVNFVMPNVKNYTEILEQMQKDRNFEKLVQAMTIAQLNGKTSAAKRHVNVGKK